MNPSMGRFRTSIVAVILLMATAARALPPCPPDDHHATRVWREKPGSIPPIRTTCVPTAPKNYAQPPPWPQRAQWQRPLHWDNFPGTNCGKRAQSAGDDAHWCTYFGPTYKASADNFWKRVEAHLPQLTDGSIHTVLEVAAGGGAKAASLQERGMAVLSTNFVFQWNHSGYNPFLEVIAERGSLGLIHDMTTAYPFVDNSFDMLHTAWSLQWVSESQFRAMLLEWMRILRPNGWIIIEAWPEPTTGIGPATIQSVLDEFGLPTVYSGFLQVFSRVFIVRVEK